MCAEEKKVGIAIVGGTGYGAAELLRICALHPRLEVVSVVSASNPGTAITAIHPHLDSIYSQSFCEEIDFSTLGRYAQSAVLLALPHGTAAEYARKIRTKLQQAKAILFDLSGDFRLRDFETRQSYYPGVSDEEQQSVVYGLPELNRVQIATANEISTPGCLASVVTLAALPLFLSSIAIKGTVVADAKTGTSGAGRSLSQAFHHPARDNDANAYKVLSHRHEPEILQNWCGATPAPFSFMFVPHIIPCSRGCMASVYFELEESVSEKQLQTAFKDAYQTEPAIRLRSDVPHLSHVVGTNYCDVHFVVRGRQLVCFAALDNLVKGAAGQMIQNLNIRFGFDEMLGLYTPALGPS